MINFRKTVIALLDVQETPLLISKTVENVISIVVEHRLHYMVIQLLGDALFHKIVQQVILLII